MMGSWATASPFVIVHVHLLLIIPLVDILESIRLAVETARAHPQLLDDKLLSFFSRPSHLLLCG